MFNAKLKEGRSRGVFPLGGRLGWWRANRKSTSPFLLFSCFSLFFLFFPLFFPPLFFLERKKQVHLLFSFPFFSFPIFSFFPFILLLKEKRGSKPIIHFSYFLLLSFSFFLFFLFFSFQNKKEVNFFPLFPFFSKEKRGRQPFFFFPFFFFFLFFSSRKKKRNKNLEFNLPTMVVRMYL